MKRLLLLCLFLPSLAIAQPLEEILVVGQSVNNVEIDPAEHLSITEAIQPTVVYTAGGFGAFAGFAERGTQGIHTNIYRNGAPANDPSTGLYDFGHDLATGNESVRVVNGPNGLLYGSGSLSGTVFLNDHIKNQTILRAGNNDYGMFSTSLGKININGMHTANRSVRSDNNEIDRYSNIGAKTVFDVGSFTIASQYIDYDYDYDNCYSESFEQSNDCLQTGKRYSASIRNENLTVAYNRTETQFYTKDYMSFENTGDRIFLDLHDTQNYNNFDIVYGMQFEHEDYITSRGNFDLYSVLTIKDMLSLGFRNTDGANVARLGFELEKFRASVGTSFRRPTLYEINGDAWVQPNENLNSEKALGYEIGFGPIDVFRYDFNEGINYDFVNNQFINVGSYTSQGVRLNYLIGHTSIFAGYTDSPQPRVPKYKASIAHTFSVAGFDVTPKWIAQVNRGIDWDGSSLDNINVIELNISKILAPNLRFSFMMLNVLAKEFEVNPGYNGPGQQAFLTIQYTH